MKDFIWTFGIGTQTITLSFRGVVSPFGNKYFVSTTEEAREGIMFEMKQQSNGKWVVLHPAPDWASRIEDMLAGAISKINGS